MSKKKKRKRVILDAYVCHGLDLPDDGTTEGNQICDCPFCGKEEHFFVNASDGRWDCKSCGENGNLFTFLAKYADMRYTKTSPERYAELSKQRGLPGKIFRRYKMSYDEGVWLMPVYSEKGTVRDVRRWVGEGKGVWSTDYCSIQLYGMYELSHSTRQQEVWICEGEWDAMAMRWLLDNCGRKMDVVVATPGAGNFKDEWIPFFAGRTVYVCSDNDDPGDKMSEKLEMKLKGTVKRMSFINWPETLPDGYDVRDLVKDAIADGTAMKEVMETMQGLLKPHRRREPTEDSPTGGGGGSSGEGVPIKFDDVLAAFRKWMKTDEDYENGIALCLAIALSNEVGGEPLWLYLIGPAGGGKTVILVSLNTSPRTAFYSTLTPASLVSGFNAHPDPSLLPQLDRKCAVFKDGTELLAMHPEARQSVYGTLRGAYDGSIYKIFGNGVTRDYKDLHFNMIIGITPMIHGDNQAAMGERFLKYQMMEHDESTHDKLMKAMDNVSKEARMGEELSEASRRFLLRHINTENLPTIPAIFLQKIAALAQVVALLRAQVDREAFGDREVRFRPVHETGTRVVKQLAKLARVLCYVFDVPEVNERIFRLIRRVAMDTCTGYHVDIVKAMMRVGNPGMSRDVVAEASRISRTNMYRRLEDLEQLEIVYKKAGTVRIRETGTIPVDWFISPSLASLWNIVWDPKEKSDEIKNYNGERIAKDVVRQQQTPAPSGGAGWNPPRVGGDRLGGAGGKAAAAGAPGGTGPNRPTAPGNPPPLPVAAKYSVANGKLPHRPSDPRKNA